MTTFGHDARATEHDYFTPEGMEGVSGCRKCHGFEGTIPTHCPEVGMTQIEQEAVYADRLDYIRGKWRVDRDSHPELSLRLFAELLDIWREKAFNLLKTRRWDSETPTTRLGMHVLEASELTEAVRGKRPFPGIIEESGDLLLTALVMIPRSQGFIPILDFNLKKIERLMTAPPYKGEENAEGVVGATE